MYICIFHIYEIIPQTYNNKLGKIYKGKEQGNMREESRIRSNLLKFREELNKCIF